MAPKEAAVAVVVISQSCLKLLTFQPRLLVLSALEVRALLVWLAFLLQEARPLLAALLMAKFPVLVGLAAVAVALVTMVLLETVVTQAQLPLGMAVGWAHLAPE